jgi:hypothetical protein
LQADGATTLVATIVQMGITAMWAALLVRHTRRLVRLARIKTEWIARDQYLRQRVHRVWWWLGRAEFWRSVQADSWRCVEITLMVFLLAWMR